MPARIAVPLGFLFLILFHFGYVPPLFGMEQGDTAPGENSLSHEPADALPSLDVGEGLRATLFAAEPMLLSPSNIDIDYRGRVWVCELVNYRGHAGKRPEGDRLLILEDTDGDGKADLQKVFYQGTDINGFHGVCVLGEKVIVSAGSQVIIFTDEDGDDQPDKKEYLFTGISGDQHDHGLHAFVFGPDGKLYFNMGNFGGQIKDKDGKTIVDAAGNEVAAHRRPYQEGMVFRCNPDGSEFETLGWNFRNNWMVTVDSFGNLWQSDNDDDGNRGVRINFVMEFGNYGYKDEMTGATWQTSRTGMHPEIPKRHWHLNDPGVVPNFLLTGGGSPTGITVYEGNLLPPIFRGQLIHCDAGPNVTRAYSVKHEGAGYTGHVVNILEGTRDRWFRPTDAQVAPDGSLIIADWYDPGVGGHRMDDFDRGRLFRVMPAEHDGSYKMPKFDFKTAKGATEALRNPNSAVRYLAWTALYEMGVAAESELFKLFGSDNTRYRARALWLLGKIEGRGSHYVALAIRDNDPDIRIVGVRLARQLKLDIAEFVEPIQGDASPQVRRELAISLRHNSSPQAATLWAALAMRHDGLDRWYLEALGIGADRQWDAFLAAWLEQVGSEWNTPAGRDILWRSRSEMTPKYLVKILADPSTPTEKYPRYFRAFDFLQGTKKKVALRNLLDIMIGQGEPRDEQAVETLLRLDDVDPDSSPPVKASLMRYLQTKVGTRRYLDLVQRYELCELAPELTDLALTRPEETVGVQAAQLVLAFDRAELLAEVIHSGDESKSIAALTVLGHVGGKLSNEILFPIVTQLERTLPIRSAAASAIGRNHEGQQKLLQLVESKKLPQDLNFVVANRLFGSSDAKIRAAAGKHLTLPSSAESKPLPPITQLVARHGNPDRGKEIFRTIGTCIKCHQAYREGKQVGPDLSEIGNKLSKEAIYLSILDPNAGISHNFETYLVLTDEGRVITGILVSETDTSVTIKTAEAIDKTIPRDEIEEIKRQQVSLMPSDLQKLLTHEQLVDLVEYLTTLQKPTP